MRRGVANGRKSESSEFSSRHEGRASCPSATHRSQSAAVDGTDFRCRRLPRPPLIVVVLGDATEV